MNGALEDFLDKNLPLSGIVACAIRFSDQSVIFHRNGDTLSEAQIGLLVNSLAFAGETLKTHQPGAHSIGWTFDQARIHLACRADGVMLAVFSENFPGQPANEAAPRLLKAFRELAAG